MQGRILPFSFTQTLCQPKCALTHISVQSTSEVATFTVIIFSFYFCPPLGRSVLYCPCHWPNPIISSRSSSDPIQGRFRSPTMQRRHNEASQTREANPGLASWPLRCAIITAPSITKQGNLRTLGRTHFRACLEQRH